MDGDLYAFTAEFVTEYRVVRAGLTAPEFRLSDHLNSSARGVDIQPHSLVQIGSDGHVNLTNSYAHLVKDELLFVVPVAEPQHHAPSANFAWKSTVQWRCWVGIGPYRITGVVHTEQGRDPIIALRLLNKQFLPLTDVTIRDARDSVRNYPAIILNRHRLDVIALTDAEY